MFNKILKSCLGKSTRKQFSSIPVNLFAGNISSE